MTGRAREASASSTTMRTSGRPAISASSLFGPPMRVERPAASTTAAMRRPAAGGGSARGCGRVTISMRSPPTPMPVMASRGTASPASKPHENPVKSVLFGRARTAGRAEQGAAARCGNQQEIAGINRHAEMLDASADRLDRGRDHVAPVGDRGGAEHDDQLGALAEHLLDGARQRALLVRHAPLGHDAGARRAPSVPPSPSRSFR